MIRVENECFSLEIGGTAERLWRYSVRATGYACTIAAPVFEIDGRSVTFGLSDVHEAAAPRRLANGATEHTFRGAAAADTGLALAMRFRLFPGSPVVRFSYTVESDSPTVESNSPRRLTKRDGRDAATYLRTSFAGLPDVTEISLSEFNELTYSYELCEKTVGPGQFEDERRIMGPMLVGSGDGHAVLLAYEHGTPAPDAFLAYRLGPDREVSLEAVKGAYYDGRVVDADHPYETVWFQIACLEGDADALARRYRSFVLHGMSVSPASRTPYVYYNTWGYQERDKEWNGNSYLDAMNEERVLAEIDVAHRMGVEVFVLDVGWFDRAGDWLPCAERFPNGFAAVRERLDRYGMKLGLWFAPTTAAQSSSLLAQYGGAVASTGGTPGDPTPLWGTEASHAMCLADERISDAFTRLLVRLVEELGVTYFKWDGVNIDGCDAPGHGHGTVENSAEERAACYTFELVRALTRIAEKLSEACPEAIVDYDITEPRRGMGLAFLSAGKFFIINHGRFANYFLPIPREEWTRDYVHLRAAMCRGPIRYDRWIPSALFLTHYLPEGSPDAQLVNVASLILGQNGIWGDLLAASPECVRLFGEVLGAYTQVRHAITESYPIITGAPGSTTECYEKLDDAGVGAVVIFSSRPGTQTYVTSARPDRRVWRTEGLSVAFDSAGRAVLEAEFEHRGARIAFFGVENDGGGSPACSRG